MKVLCVGYRKWARDAYFDLYKKYHAALEVAGPRLVATHSLDFAKDLPSTGWIGDVVFLIGWSEIVPDEFWRGVPTYVVHPSKLPEYRGGSPIQHQMIDGVWESAVTVFRLDGSPLDAGPIAAQRSYVIGNNYLDEVLLRIRKATVGCLLDLLLHSESVHDFRSRPQDWLGHKPRRRRLPGESAMTPTEFQHTRDGVEFERKVRALQPPYPQAYISLADGGRLVIERARYEPLGWETKDAD